MKLSYMTEIEARLKAIGATHAEVSSVGFEAYFNDIGFYWGVRDRLVNINAPAYSDLTPKQFIVLASLLEYAIEKFDEGCDP